MNRLTLIRRGAFEHRLRTILLIVTIAIAFLVFGLLAGFERISRGDPGSNPTELVVSNRASVFAGVPRSYAEFVRRHPAVASAAEVNVFPGYVGDAINDLPLLIVDRRGFEEHVVRRLRLSAEDRAAFLGTRDGILVDSATAGRLRWKRGDRVVVTNVLAPGRDGPDWTFTMSGTFEAEGDMAGGNSAFGHAAYYDENAPSSGRRAHWIMLETRSAEAAGQVAADIDAQFVNGIAATRTEPASSLAQALTSQLVDLSTIMTAVVSACFVTILFIFGNTFSSTVRSRSSQIGVLRTLGFTPGAVRAMIVSEALLIASIGGIIGLGLAALLLSGMAAALGIGASALALPAEVALAGIVIMIGLGIVVGLVPAWRSARIEPARAFVRS